MAVHVRLFAAFADYAGKHEIEVTYQPGMRCSDVWQQLVQAHPRFAQIPVLFALGDEYVSQDTQLQDDATLLLFPPLSGGDHTQYIFEEPLSLPRALERIQDADGGGQAIFVGKVRRQSGGKIVRYLYYDCYRTMAEKEISGIIGEMFSRWALKKIDVQHRIGKLEVGEAAVIIAVSAEHRAEAMDACRYGIDELKRRVPIWKKEVSESGEEWVGL